MKGREAPEKRVVSVSIRLEMEFNEKFLDKTSKEYQDLKKKFLENVSLIVVNCSSKRFFLFFIYQSRIVPLKLHRRCILSLVNMEKNFLKINTPEPCSK